MPLLRLEEYLVAGQYIPAQREAERIMAHPDYPNEIRARAAVSGARACMELQEYHAAARMAEDALRWAEADGNSEVIGLARFRLGWATMWVGDPPEAIRLFNRFIQELDRYPDLRRLEARARFNLGLLHVMQNDVTEGLRCYEEAFTLAAEQGDGGLKLKTLHNSAWVLLLAGRPDDARPYLVRAEALLPQAGLEDQIHHLCHRALYLRARGQLAESLALCEEIFVPNRDGVTVHHKAEAAWIAGENALDLGQLEEARIFCNLATQYALEARWSRLLSLASRLRNRTYRVQYSSL